MTIHYPNGTILEAVLLSRGSDTLRASVPGDNDVRTFTLINECWISEECEPVKFEFAWERRSELRIPSEAECICSPELASHLTSLLLVGTQAGDLVHTMLSVNAAEGHRVTIHEGRLIALSADVAPSWFSHSALLN
jgi:hypothetical protein